MAAFTEVPMNPWGRTAGFPSDLRKEASDASPDSVALLRVVGLKPVSYAMSASEASFESPQDGEELPKAEFPVPEVVGTECGPTTTPAGVPGKDPDVNLSTASPLIERTKLPRNRKSEAGELGKLVKMLCRLNVSKPFPAEIDSGEEDSGALQAKSLGSEEIFSWLEKREMKRKRSCRSGFTSLYRSRSEGRNCTFCRAAKL